MTDEYGINIVIVDVCHVTQLIREQSVDLKEECPSLRSQRPVRHSFKNPEPKKI